MCSAARQLQCYELYQVSTPSVSAPERERRRPLGLGRSPHQTHWQKYTTPAGSSTDADSPTGRVVGLRPRSSQWNVSSRQDTRSVDITPKRLHHYLENTYYLLFRGYHTDVFMSAPISSVSVDVCPRRSRGLMSTLFIIRSTSLSYDRTHLNREAKIIWNMLKITLLSGRMIDRLLRYLLIGDAVARCLQQPIRDVSRWRMRCGL